MLYLPRVTLLEGQHIDLQVNGLVMPLREAHNFTEGLEELSQGCLELIQLLPILGTELRGAGHMLGGQYHNMMLVYGTLGQCQIKVISHGDNEMLLHIGRGQAEPALF